MKKAIILSLFSLFATASFSQSLGIGTNTPDSSAQLDVFSNNKGFLPPRIALQSLDSPNPISKPATGLLVYNTATAGNSPNNVFPGYYYWNGSTWSKISQDNTHQLPGVTIKNFTESQPQNEKTFKVPSGKVWKLTYCNKPIRILEYAGFSPYQGNEIGKFDVFLNQNDSFFVAGPFFISIAEYSTSTKIVKTFNDSLLGNATKSYIVPANKIWKANFIIVSNGGLGISVGNTTPNPIFIPNPAFETQYATDVFFAPNTEIQLVSTNPETLRYFISFSEFDE